MQALVGLRFGFLFYAQFEKLYNYAFHLLGKLYPSNTRYKKQLIILKIDLYILFILIHGNITTETCTKSACSIISSECTKFNFL